MMRLLVRLFAPWTWKQGSPIAGYAMAAAGVLVVTAIIGLVLSVASVGNVSTLYLLVVLPVAARYGFGPAIAASLFAFLAFNWFHIQPLHTWTIARPEELIALLLALVVSVVTSQLAAAQRRRAEEAVRREREAVALGHLSRLINATDDLSSTLTAACEHLRATLGLRGCALLLPERDVEGGPLRPRVVIGDPLPPPELAAAPWVAPRLAAPGGAGRHWVRVRAPGPPAAVAGVEYVPLRAGDQAVGMLRLAARTAGPTRSTEDQRLVSAAADLLGRAIERDRLRREATQAEVLRQAEEARQALLASLSHDLRTPLAAIRASAETLVQPGVEWSSGDRQSFVAAIVQETQRMNRLIENLLDMTRIEAGRLRPDLSLYPFHALVDDVLQRLEPLTARHTILVDVPESLPPVPLDYVQIGEVLANLIENAVKYTPPGTTISLHATAAGRHLRVVVQDDGPGIPPESLPRVFEKFYRVAQRGDGARVKGTGLGLAIARGFVEAHSGTLEAVSPPPGQPRGTQFILRLPLAPSSALIAV